MTNQQLVDELVGNAHGNIERVQQILGAHPELVNAAASWGETPIQAAAQNILATLPASSTLAIEAWVSR